MNTVPKKIIVKEGFGWCSKCQNELPLSAFHKCAGRKSGYERYCKDCRREYTRKRCGHTPLVIPPPGRLYCARCGTIKDISEFSPSHVALGKGRKTRRGGCCRACVRQRSYFDEPKTRSAVYGLNHHSAKKFTGAISRDPLALAYCAGVFDAEGSAQLSTGFTPHPSISFSANNEVLLKAVQAHLGGSVIYYERVIEKGKDAGRTVSEGRLTIATLDHVRKICRAIMPFLRLKRDRCKLLDASCEASPHDRIAIRNKLDVLNAKCVRQEFIKLETKTLNDDDVFDMTEERFAYLAGFVDGDGWIGFSKRQPCVSVSTSKYEIVSGLHSLFGGYTNEVWSEEDNATICRWAIRADNEAWGSILKRLSKHLSLKKAHAELTLQAIRASSYAQYELCEEMKRLTAEAREEKFIRAQDNADMERLKANVPTLAERMQFLEIA